MPQRCGRDYTKETDISSSIRLRGVIMARNRKGIPTVTSRQYGKRAIFVPDDVRFQDGDAVDIGTLGGGAFFRLLVSFNVCIYHCCASYWFLGNASNGSRSPSLPRYIPACRVLCDSNNKWYENIEWSLHLFQKEDKTIVYSWLTLKESAWPTVAFVCCFLSILFQIEISALWLV